MRKSSLVFIALIAIGLTVGTLRVASTHQAELTSAVNWFRDAGPAGVVVYILGFAIAVACMLPIAVLSASAGFIYGRWGFCIAPIACVLGATLGFTIGRFVAREWVARRVAADARFQAIDRAIGVDGLKIALLLRLSPFIPHNLLNYALAVTKLRLRDFVLGSMIGMLPLTAIQVYAGTLARSAAELLDSGLAGFGPWSWVLTGLGIAMTLTVLVIIMRIARRALARALTEATEVTPANGV